MVFPILGHNGKVILVDFYDLLYKVPEAKSIALWKVAPTFIRPNDILKYMKVPHGLVNAVLSWSSLLSKTWLYPENPSGIDIIPAPVTL